MSLIRFNFLGGKGSFTNGSFVSEVPTLAEQLDRELAIEMTISPDKMAGMASVAHAMLKRKGAKILVAPEPTYESGVLY